MADAIGNENQSNSVSEGKETTDDATNTQMPATYPYIDEALTGDHRQKRFSKDIITDCKPCECDYGFEFHSDEEICFNGEWQAVWTSRHLGCDVLVLVKKKCFPNALVELVEPFCCSHPNSFADYALDGSGHKPKTKEDVTKFLSARKYRVPLLELLPVLHQPQDLNKEEKKEEKTKDTADGDDGDDEDSEEEPEMDINQIAEFLELYRFFYTYMWRVVYDENFGGDKYFTFPGMYYRMKLHYDVKNKKTTPAIIKSYNKTMAEYKIKTWQFNEIRDDYKNPKQDEELQKIGDQVVSLEKTLEKLNKQNQKRY